MTEKEIYNLINNQNNQQSNGFAVNEKERGISGVFSALMRKVYTSVSYTHLQQTNQAARLGKNDILQWRV